MASDAAGVAASWNSGIIGPACIFGLQRQGRLGRASIRARACSRRGRGTEQTQS